MLTRKLGSRLVSSSSLFKTVQQTRFYRHWNRMTCDDFELPLDSMPENVKELMTSKKHSEMTVVEQYWYWKIRGETTLMDAENLPKKSYEDLAKDLGLTQVTTPTSHMMGLLELYEYLSSAPFVGPFGTVEQPVLIPSIAEERVVGCTGGTGDDEHLPLWFRCREGFLYRCGECDQIFIHVRVNYEGRERQSASAGHIEIKDKDIFDLKNLARVHGLWNKDERILHWKTGYLAQDYVAGKGSLPGMQDFHSYVN
jgi:cytochrome c oxidase subunit 5b